MSRNSGYAGGNLDKRAVSISIHVPLNGGVSIRFHGMQQKRLHTCWLLSNYRQVVIHFPFHGDQWIYLSFGDYCNGSLTMGNKYLGH